MSPDHTPYYYYKGIIEIVVCGYLDYMDLHVHEGQVYKLYYNSFYNAPETFVLPSYVLSVHNRVHILENSYLSYNNVTTYLEDVQFKVGIGVYFFLNISPDYPMTFLNSGFEEIVELESLAGTVIAGLGPNGAAVNFYVGVLRMTIRGNFGFMSTYTLTNGYMGGYKSIQYSNETNEASYPDPRSVPKIDALPDNIQDKVIVLPVKPYVIDCTSKVYVADPNLTYIEVFNIRRNTLDVLLQVTYTYRFVLQVVQEPFLDTHEGLVEYVFGRGIYALSSSEYITIMNKGKENKIRMFSVLQSLGTASDGNSYVYSKGESILLYVLGNFGRISLESKSGKQGINLFRHEATRE
jgi:hypothetical protein